MEARRLKPEGDWVIKDESVTPQLILSFAEEKTPTW